MCASSLLKVLMMVLLMATALYAQPILLPTSWDIIGPFPRGEREQGADPLECWGGIGSVAAGAGGNDTFGSELGVDGRVGWSSAEGNVTVGADETQPSTVAVGPLDFSIWNESFLQAPYGWAMLLWQGWAVGTVRVPQGNRFLLACNGTRELLLDGLYLHGDWYSYGVLYNVVTLASGNHTLAVKLESSVRLYGSTSAMSFACSFQVVVERLWLLPGAAVLPDLLEGRPVTPFAAVAVINTADQPLADVQVFLGNAPDNSSALSQPLAQLAAGQSTSLAFALPLPWAALNGSQPTVAICIASSSFRGYCLATTELDFVTRTAPLAADAPFQFTFQDYDGSVQAAVAIMGANSSQPKPVVLATHGAGVDAADPFWTGSLPPLPSAVVLFPTGRRPWGYDWHGPSALNVFHALRALQPLLPLVSGQGVAGVNASRVVFTGHSMGGAGCWYLATHYPDVALGAACAAGFLSLQKYVPVWPRLATSHTDPFLAAVLEASVASYEADLHLSNLVGVPVLARYGAADDNVPPWHSKRAARVLAEWAGDPAAAQVSEVAGEGHWFPDVMNGTDMANFYNALLANDAPLPPFPTRFTVACLDPGSTGAKGSFQILQLLAPFRMGRLNVEHHGDPVAVSVTSENVIRFCITEDSRSAALRAASLQLDGQTFGPPPSCASQHYCLNLATSLWQLCAPNDWSLTGRRPNQYGPAAKVLEQRFLIVYGGNAAPASVQALAAQAVLLANDWFLYSNGNVTVLPDNAVPASMAAQYNLILLGDSSSNRYIALLEDEWGQVLVTNATQIQVGQYVFRGAGLGCVYLAPWNGGLALVLAGVDDVGRRSALLAFPYRSGQTVPDWMVLAPDFPCRGDGAVLGAGYWTNKWQYSSLGSYVRPAIPLLPPVDTDTPLFAALVTIAAAAVLVTALAAGVFCWLQLRHASRNSYAPID